MLTVLITANNEDVDIENTHLEMLKFVSEYEKDVQMVFLAKENYKHLELLKAITLNVKNHALLVADSQTSDDELVYMGIACAEDTDVILCTIDTVPDVLIKLIEKSRKGYKIIKVRRKLSNFKSFFRVIGTWGYNLGLKLNGKKNYDNFSEVRIGYFDHKIVNNLTINVENNREKRITHSYKQVQNGILEAPQLYLNDEHRQAKDWNILGFGVVTFLYLLCLVAILSIYPCLHDMTYSWWMIIIIVAWVGFGLLYALLTARKIYILRCGTPNRVDVNGQPDFGLLNYLQYGDADIDYDEDEDQKEQLPQQKIKSTEIKKPVIKHKVNLKKNKKGK